MSNSDSYLLLERYAKGKEDSLIESYIQDGPTALREKLGFSDEDWQVIFDYLVYGHNLLNKTVLHSLEFFVDSYVKYGAAHVRGILGIESDKYDDVWRFCFDFVAISNEGLYYHVLEHRERYIVAFRARGGDFVRKVLGIWNERYEEHWAKILNLLLNGVCHGIFSEQTFERGLKSFSKVVNGLRQHRPVEKSEILSRGLV